MFTQLAPPRWLADLLAAYEDVFAELFWFVAGFAVEYVLGRVLLEPIVTRVVRARNRNNPTIETATKTYLRVALVAFGTLTGILVAGYGAIFSETAIIIAAITFALGIAGQQVFGSLISGMFLVADPDFNVGDWIEWPGGAGTIEEVDFRVTRIRTPDNETISVPNTLLTSNELSRPYGRDRYRVTEEFFVSYEEDTERALFALRQLANDQDAVIDEPEPNARITDLGANAVTVQAEFWIEGPANTDVLRVRSDFRRQVKRHFDAEGITLAPPSSQSLSGELTVREGAAA